MSQHSGHIRDEAVWEFTRCQRANGTYYGTGGVCRKGVQADKAEEVKKALAASQEEYNRVYYPKAQALLDENAKAYEERVSGTPRSELSAADNMRVTASRRMEVTVEDYKELAGTNAEAAAQLKSTKELFDDMKWKLGNEQVFVSEGTLRGWYEGKDMSKKANAVYPEQAKSSKFGQSKAAIGEHALPTAVLKQQLMSRDFSGHPQLASFIMQRNFLSWVDGPADARMTAAGYRSKTPDPNDVFARYKAVGIKALPIKRDGGLMTKDGQGMNTKRWMESAAAARARGESFEDWAATVIEF